MDMLSDVFPSACPHGLNESLKHVQRVVRAGGRLRVVLDAERRQRIHSEAFGGAVVEMDMRRTRPRRQAGKVDAEAMILRGDFDASCGKVLHGLIRAAMDA